MRNLIYFGISAATLIVSGFWMFFSPGFDATLGLLGGASGTIATWPFTRQPRLSSAERVQAREHWRPIFEEFFRERGLLGSGVDAIVHDVGRIDTYPEISEEKGVSSWFRIGLAGTYHRGILLGLKWSAIAQGPDGKWKEVPSQEGDAKFVALLGKVPYECIEKVNWDGDHFYAKPHLFLHFDYNGEPYEQIVFAEETHPDHYTDIVDYADTVPPALSWRRPIQAVKRFLF